MPLNESTRAQIERAHERGQFGIADFGVNGHGAR